MRNLGKTIYEKILVRVSGEKAVSPGDVIWIKPDLVALTDLNFRKWIPFETEIGVRKLANPDRIVVVVDHCPELTKMPAGTEDVKYIREWVKKYDVSHFYDIGRNGTMPQILVERGHVLPGMMVIGNDQEVEGCNALGAFASFEDVFTGLTIGEIWYEAREISKFEVTGSFSTGVSSLDLRQAMLRDLGAKASDMIIEFTGPTVSEMSIDARMNLCTALSFSSVSAVSGIIAADQKAKDYLRSKTAKPFEAIESDPDAEYRETFDYDVSKLPPQVAIPPNVNDVNEIAEAEGVGVDEACIGSCTGARLEDLRAAAEILKGKRIHPRVRMYVSPVSHETYLNALKEGLVETFVRAGAIVLGTHGCTTCAGRIGQLASGETCIATHPVNYPGRMGSSEAKVYLASSMTVAASAVMGQITDPRKLLGGK